MQTITVHSPGCPALAGEGLHVPVQELNALAGEIFMLMENYNISFFQVQPHDDSCPGHHFPWEDLEFRLFVLSH